MQSWERKMLVYINITGRLVIHPKEYSRTVEDSCLFTSSSVMTPEQYLTAFLKSPFWNIKYHIDGKFPKLNISSII